MSSASGLSENPRLSITDAREILRSAWGIDDAEVIHLGSLQDQNLRVTRPDGTRFVLKVNWLGGGSGELDLQNAAMRHVAARRAGFESPEPVPALDGRDIVRREGHAARLLTWVDGVPLGDRSRLSRADLVALGALAGQVTRAMTGFEHPAMDRALVWDIKRSRVVADDLVDQVTDAGHRRLLDAAMAGFGQVAALAAELPVQVLHADLTEMNAVCRGAAAGDWTPTGLLDFGDTVRTWRVGDVVAATTAAAGHEGVDDVLDAVVAVVSGYNGACPLTEAEAEACWPLTLARSAVGMAVTVIQHELNPDSEYAARDAAASIRALERVLEVPAELGRAAVRRAAGLAASPAGAALTAWLDTARPVPMITGLPGSVRLLDLSVTSESFAFGEWREPGAVARLAAAAPGGGAGSGTAVARWAEGRLTDSGEPGRTPPANLHLGVDVLAPAGTPVLAPAGGAVHSRGDGEIVLRLRPAGRDAWLRVAGIAAEAELAVGTDVSAGTVLGVVAASEPGAEGADAPELHVQLQTAPGLPGLGTAAHQGAWLAICPDPSALLGIAAAADRPADAGLRERERAAHVAAPQHLYYEQPTEIVRGWRHHLYDADGRPYLDMINNIASVGHSHPRIAAAAWRQLGKLNTNSRFLYDSMSRYCARIAELLPPELGSIFLVNSGSEAADLALQLAQIATGRKDIVALAGAYHGWTGAVLEVCTSPMDRPHWQTEIGPGTHIAEQPDPYRGAFGSDAAAYCASVERACRAARERGGVAAFLTEPLLGNQGAVEPPAGYLAGAYDIVRRAGGLCVADEVQVGMGRTGSDFWAFQHEGVVPDIVYTAKATGNGHPLGVVACRPEIAAAFDGRTAYFSSTGGGPVSCEIGIAVLDVLRDEGLPENARQVGAYLKAGLQGLASRHELIGAVHGRGLYLGVDLVRDRAAKEPAVAEAMAVSESLRALGVIMQPTGDAFNVLKVKPPLCIDRAAADFFVAALDRALGFLS